MPGLKKLVSSLRLGKEKHNELPEAARNYNAPAALKKKKSAKLHKPNKSALDLNRVSQSKSKVINGLEHSDAVRPQFARRFMRSFVHSRQSSFEPGVLDEDFDAELREIAALRQSREAGEPSQAQELQFGLSHDESTVPRLGMRVGQPDPNVGNCSAALVSPAAGYGEPSAYGDDLRTSRMSDSVLVRGPAVNETGTIVTPGWSSFVDAMALGVNSAAALERQRQTNSQIVPTSSPTEPLSGLLHIPRRAGPYRQRQGKKPAIRDIDWDQVDDEDVAAFVEEYSDISPVSPPDSAVALPESDSPPYSGKGKARADSNVRVSLGVFEDALREFLIEEEKTGHRQELQKREDEARAKSLAILEAFEEQQRQDYEAAARLVREEDDRLQALELQEQLERELEEEERLVVERGRLRDCAVCGDAKDPLDFPARAPTSMCDHAPQTCNECLQSWMASEFDTKGCDGIKCVECPQLMDYIDVQRAASAVTFEAYDKMSTRNALGSLDEFGWCLAPGCTSGQLNVENSNYMDCASCGYKQCLKHKVKWHANETCEQYEYRTSGQKARDEDRATEAMLDAVSKKCPGATCGWRIQKTDGCDHMTCKKCRFEFCWQCLASQTEIKRVGNTAHETWCKFHSLNLEVAWPFNVH